MNKRKVPTGQNSPLKTRAIVPGSDRKLLPGAKPVGEVDPNQRIEITVQLRRRSGTDVEQSANRMAAKPLNERQYLTRQQLAAQAGAGPADIAAVDAFAQQNNLTVSEVSVPRRTVKLAGRVADLSSAFGVELKQYKAGEVVYRGRTGVIYIPKELAGIVERVLGFDDRPVAAPHYRLAAGTKAVRRKSQKPQSKNSQKSSSSPSSGSRGFTPPEVAKLYNFPTGLDGGGQTIALIELNDVNNDGTAVG